MSPYSFLYSLFHSEKKPSYNLAYYANPAFDKTIDTANQITGVDKQKASDMYVESQKTLIDDAISAYFYDLSNNHISRADVKGYVDNPAYPHVVFVYDLSR
jgi:peptide/nickel transport system substrate-binding protein